MMSSRSRANRIRSGNEVEGKKEGSATQRFNRDFDAILSTMDDVKLDAAVLSESSHQHRPQVGHVTNRRALATSSLCEVRESKPVFRYQQPRTAQLGHGHGSSRTSSSQRHTLQSSNDGNVREGYMSSTNSMRLSTQPLKPSGAAKEKTTGTLLTKRTTSSAGLLTSSGQSSRAWPKERLERISKALPVGWEMRMSRSHGEPYYHKQCTGVITWICPIPLDSMNEPITKSVDEKPAVLCAACDEKVSGDIRSTYADRENGEGYQCSKCKDPAIYCQGCALDYGSFCAGSMCDKFYCGSCRPNYLGDLGDDQYCGRTCMGKDHPDYRKYSRHRVAYKSDDDGDDVATMEFIYGYRQCKGITKKGFRCEVESSHDLWAASSLQTGDDFCLHHGGRESEFYDY